MVVPFEDLETASQTLFLIFFGLRTLCAYAPRPAARPRGFGLACRLGRVRTVPTGDLPPKPLVLFLSLRAQRACALRQDLGLSRLPTRSVAGRAPLGHSNPKPTGAPVYASASVGAGRSPLATSTPRPRKGVSVCQWQTSCEPTEPAGETHRPLDPFSVWLGAFSLAPFTAAGYTRCLFCRPLCTPGARAWKGRTPLHN